ncbi:hypothetical protein [Verrucomicrobium sp. GAS474]|uniref:hypothetical protein n=1 Tax=Verrucomicrobium sp. GAS474 TaxID=1882831 RepID=UPI0012FFB459|nr:hypothetical protein [Verrucomicrobium sp. GAS474]
MGVRAGISTLFLSAFYALCVFSPSPVAAAEATDPDSGLTKAKPKAAYPWKKNIVTTNFWIGQGSSSYSDTTNSASAWDEKWTKNYGGVDDPTRHEGFVPKKFAATQNPFYVALPFNDVVYPELAKKYCPWYKTPGADNRYISQCKGKWIQIMNRNGKSAYAQWQDVGPIRTDMASYVFGDARPKEFNGAGLDVSPAVAAYLGLTGLDKTHWRFVDDSEVPSGPWLTYGEEAIIYAALKQKERELADGWRPGKKVASIEAQR